VFSFKIRHLTPDPETLDKPEPPSPMPNSAFEDSLSELSIRRSSSPNLTPTKALSGPGPPIDKSERSEEYRKWDERGREWLYGYVWFEQRKDVDVARGYMQVGSLIRVER
jgi:hypothetical protein